MRFSLQRLHHGCGAFLTIAMLLAISVPASADVRTEARRHFRRGMDLLSEGQTDAGVAALEEAYATLPHPNVLYNIGKAYAEADRYDEALAYFERYLESNPADSAEVSEFVASLRSRRDAAAEPTTTATTPASATSSAAVAVSDDGIVAIEESADQLDQLARASDSDSLRQRAARLRELAANLRARGGGDSFRQTPTPQDTARAASSTTPPTQTTEEGGEGPELSLGDDRTGVFEEEIISASRFAESPLDAPNSTHIITRQDIRLSGLTHISELLRRVAGVDVMRSTPGHSDVGIRGLNQRQANKVLFLVDGRSVRLDFLAAPLASMLPWGVEDIERIEVIRGPAAAVYGADAFSGIVNIITRSPRHSESYVTVRAGNGNTFRSVASASGNNDRLGLRVSGGYERMDNYAAVVARDRVDTSVWRGYGDPDVGLERVFFNGDARIDLGSGYTLLGGSGVTTRGRAAIAGISRLRQVAVDELTFAQSHVQLNTPFGVQLRSHWTRFATDLSSWDVPEGSLDTTGDLKRSDVVDTELAFSQRFHAGIDQHIAIGLGHRFKQVEWDWLELPRITEHHAFVYLQDALQLHRKLRLTLSARIDRHPRLSRLQFSPRGSLVWRLLEGQAIRLTAGTAFRSPSFVESYLQFPNRVSVRGATAYGVGNRELKPERIVSMELGYANQATDYFALEVNAYYNLVFDQIVLSSIETFRLSDFGPTGPESADGDPLARYLDDSRAFPLGRLQFANESTTFRQIGGEIGIRVFPVDGADLYVNYALHDTEPTDSNAIDDAVRAQDERTSTHKINVGAQYRSPMGLALNLDVHWVSRQVWVEQVTDLRQGVAFARFPLDPHVLVNARVGWSFLEDRLELSVIGTNLTGRRRRQHPLGQPVATRVMGEATVRF